MAISKEVKAEWVVLYKRGITNREIAQKFGCHMSTVTAHIKSVGVYREPKPIPVELKKCWPAKYRDGSTVAEIAREDGVSYYAVYEYIINYGVVTRRRLASGGRGYVLNKGYYIYTTGKNKDKRVHRVVMEEVLGRPLTRKEVVHHVDGDTLNNNKTNLVLFSDTIAHTKYHRKMVKENSKLIQATTTFRRKFGELETGIGVRDLVFKLNDAVDGYTKERNDYLIELAAPEESKRLLKV